jgi:hypothetical protein
LVTGLIKNSYKRMFKKQINKVISEKRLEFVDDKTIRYTDKTGTTRIYSFKTFSTAMVVAFIAHTSNDESVKKAEKSFGMNVGILSSMGLSDDTFLEALNEVYQEKKTK